MDAIDDMDKDNFVAVDLHVHTPASSQCYDCGKSNNSNEEYIELLELYRSKNIKVIAITDHNTIKGYKKLLEIKSEIERKVSYWKELGDIPGVKEKLEVQLNILKLFEDILILPGVEFEAFPGIHLLLIFNPDIDIIDIDTFLCESGYNDENQGKEKCQISQLSVPEVLEKARNLGAITIAAHIDRDKGIFSSLNRGRGKAQVFKTDSLMGVQVNNLAIISQVKALLDNKEYKREKPLAFIRCSDFHKTKLDVENYVTYMKLDDLNFYSIFDCFMNPIERISFTPNPEKTEIINELIKNKNAITFRNASDENIVPISKAVCALLNYGHGVIIIGIDDDKSIIGIRKNRSECEQIISNILDKIEGSKYLIDYEITTYEYGNGNVLVLNLGSTRNSLYNINNEVYILKDKNISLASPYDLVKIGEERFINKFTEIQSINKKRIESIYNELEVIKRFDDNLSLYNKINSNSVRITEALSIKFIDRNAKDDADDILYDLSEGTFDGNLFFVNDYSNPHGNGFYLRCTCPKTSEDVEIDFDSEIYKEDCIIIIPGGGCHYIRNKEEFRIINTIPILMLTINEKYKDVYSVESIVAWMKSPILLWYINFKFDTIDIFQPSTLKDMPLPMIGNMKPGQDIPNIIEQITDKEMKFLSEAKFLNEDTGQVDLVTLKDVEDSHNSEVSNLAMKIEKNIIKELGISDDEIELIEMFLIQKNLTEIFHYDLD